MRDQDPDAVNYYRLHFLDGEGGYLSGEVLGGEALVDHG